MKDGELLEKVREYISLSQTIQKDCSQYGFPFFDVSKDWQGTIKIALTHIFNLLS